MTRYAGIDPGLDGAIAVLDEDAKLVEIIDMPTLHVTKSRRIIDPARVIRFLKFYAMLDLRVTIEEAMILPRQGSASGFKIGTGYGMLLGILAALEIPMQRTNAKRWQQAILGSCPPGTSKDRARAYVQARWPHADLGKRKSQDRSDAMCIALYGVRSWSWSSRPGVKGAA